MPRSSPKMAIAITLQLISAWIVVVLYRVSALPTPQAISEEESWMRSALLTLRDLAVSCKFISASNFACIAAYCILHSSIAWFTNAYYNGMIILIIPSYSCLYKE